MNISEMHYDFKKKLNKVDSQQNRNLLVPEIDWALNEAQELFIKWIAEPRQRSYMGFEKSQRSIDDIRTLVESDKVLLINNGVAPLPSDYLFFVKADVLMDKGNCKGVKGRLHIRQHDDEFENSPFDKSNFEWRVVNGLFITEGVKVFDDGTFTNKQIIMSYIRKPKYIHNAAAFRNGTYQLPSGIELPQIGDVGVVARTCDCELPEHTHREIVDIAVALVSGELLSPDYQVKLSKLNFNELK